MNNAKVIKLPSHCSSPSYQLTQNAGNTFYHRLWKEVKHTGCWRDEEDGRAYLFCYLRSLLRVATRSSVFCSTQVSLSFPFSFFSRLLSSILLLLLSSLAASFTFLRSSFLCFSFPYIPLSLCFFFLFFIASSPSAFVFFTLSSLCFFSFCLVAFFLFSLSVPFFPPVFSSSPLSLSPFSVQYILWLL